VKSLHSLSYKFLFTILFLALAGIVFFLKIGGKTQKVSAAWWNDSWHYRQSINISSHTSLESNVYITTAINIGSTTKAQIDGGDFRFISQSGENLSYYIVSGAGTTNVSFHILIPSFPANTSTIYAYYGNSTIENGFSAADFSTQASNYTVGSLSSEEVGGGPIAYWKFDEGVGTTAYDSAGFSNGVFGTGSSAPTWADESQCISGKCLSFNGTTNLVNLPAINNIKSISMWIYIYSSQPGGSYYILDARTGLSNGWLWAGGFGSNWTKMYVNGVNKTVSWANIPQNQWVNLYFESNTIFSDDVNLMSRYSNNEFLKGKLDEVKFYSHARTPAQILQDYNSRGTLSGSSANLGVQSNTSPSLKSSLVAYYKFKENNGTKVYDSTTNTSGTLTNGPIWVRNNLGIGVSLGGYGSNDYIALSNQALNNATTWSISTKLKYTNLAKTFEFFLGKNDLTTGKILLRHNGYISFRGTNGTYYDFSTTSAEINNLDTNLLFISNGSTIKLYIDGLYKSSITPGSTSISIDTIGNAWTDTVWTSAMVINELKIYNTALTDEQIKQDYNQGSAIQFGSTNQTIGGTTTSLDYCIPGDTSYCASPVAEWKMDEGVGTSIIDTSGNSNTGTFGAGSSAPTWAQGKIGNGLSFNGTNQYISINDNTILKPTTTITVESWFNTSNKTLTGQRIVSKTEASGYQLSLNETSVCGSTNLCFTLNFGGTYYTATYPVSNLSNNIWYHATGVYDGNTVKLFLNGLNVGTTSTISSSINQSTPPLCIGSEPSTTVCNAQGGNFSGKIDHVKIYNYARTPAQVAYDYNRGGPVIHLKFDECQGNVVYNWSGIGNTGSINIGPSGSQNSIGTCQVGTSATWTNGATGKFNSSLSFDGNDDYVRFPNTAIGLNKPFTISSWFKTSTNFAYQPGIVSLGYYPIIVMKTDGKIRAWWYNGVTYPGIESVKAYNDGIFHHTTLTYDGTTAKLYIDGNLESSIVSVIYSIYDYFEIGLEKNAGIKIFNGQIDDARLYRYALTPDQIKQVYNGGAISFN